MSRASRGVVIPLDVLLFLDDKLNRREIFLILPIAEDFPLLPLSLLPPLLRSPPPLPLPTWRRIISPGDSRPLLNSGLVLGLDGRPQIAYPLVIYLGYSLCQQPFWALIYRRILQSSCSVGATEEQRHELDR